MECPDCQADNPEGAKFCLDCGARLTVVCPECGTRLPSRAKFCLECGARVVTEHMKTEEIPDELHERVGRLVPREYAERLLASGRQMAGERRVVTILFCDVTGSTAIAEALDPEDVMAIMDGAFDVMIEPIARYEGTVARLMGDAVLAFFGAPTAHEGDPERACRAGLEIVAGARAYGETLARERGIEGFDVRVAINTGLVVVGEVGSDLRMEYTAMGDAINLTAGLEEAADPGTVVVTEATEKLIAPLFETKPLGPIELKGKAEPVLAYQVVKAKPEPATQRVIAGLDSPVVGREAEFAALRGAMEGLRVGLGGIVTIVGEAGIGKSRLVAELRKEGLANSSESSPVPGFPQWVEGRCLSYGTSIAYLLWLDVLRELLGVTPEDAPIVVRDALRREVKRLCPEREKDVYPYLARLMSLPLTSESEAHLQSLAGKQLKAKTFHAVETLIECAASDRPLVLVCEDLHWADSISMELLEHVLAVADRAALLLLCVFRPETAHGSWRLRETAARDYRHRHIDLRLEPLSAGESEALVHNLLRMEDLPSKLRWRMLSQAEGNPFYLEEILRSLIAGGAIAQDETTGCWEAVEDVADIPIPDTLRGVLLARIDRLREETKRVLQLASVIGRIFPYRILAAIVATETVAREERVLEAHLLTLQRQELIRERARLPELEYIFKHELTREAAYNGLLKKERRVFHRRVAEALEELFPERAEEQAGLLARHWLQAGEEERAVPYLLEAGDQARALYAHAEAERFYREAVRVLRAEGHDELAARTLMKLGLVYTAAFRPEEAQVAYEEAFSLWEPLRASSDLREERASSAVLHLALEEPLTLDSGMMDDDVSTFVAAQLFEGLAEVDPDNNVLPAAAARWEVADRGKMYIFHLREGLRWSDGSSLTAADFEYAWKRNLAPATRSPVAHLLYPIENARAFGEGEIDDSRRVGVAALDDLTLEVRLKTPTAYLPYLVTHPIAYPLPKRVMETRGRGWSETGDLVGNGAYELVAWERGERLILGRNPFYRGPFPGNAEGVECQIFSQYGSALEAYVGDDVDVVTMFNADPGTVGRARARYGGELVSIPRPITFYLVFRTDQAPFDDVRVRQAFAHAVDREALVRDALHGERLPATGGFVPPGMPAHSRGLGLSYDPDRARRLLAAAGYPGGRGFPVVTWLISGGSRDERVVPFLRQAWREHLGLDVEVRSLEWGPFLERLRRDPADLTLAGWSADYLDPDNLLRIIFHGTEGLNYPRWDSARFDALIDEAAEVTDQARRIELYREADRILVAEETVVMPVSYGQGRILVKPWVVLPRVPSVPMRLKNVLVQRGRRGARDVRLSADSL